MFWNGKTRRLSYKKLCFAIFGFSTLVIYTILFNNCVFSKVHGVFSAVSNLRKVLIVIFCLTSFELFLIAHNFIFRNLCYLIEKHLIKRPKTQPMDIVEKLMLGLYH